MSVNNELVHNNNPSSIVMKSNQIISDNDLNLKENSLIIARTEKSVKKNLNLLSSKSTKKAKVPEEELINLSPKQKFNNDKISKILNFKSNYRNKDEKTETNTKFSLNDLECLNKKSSNTKKGVIIEADFDFSLSSKKSKEEVIMTLEIGTSKAQYLKIYREIENLLNN